MVRPFTNPEKVREVIGEIMGEQPRIHPDTLTYLAARKANLAEPFIIATIHDLLNEGALKLEDRVAPAAKEVGTNGG